MKEKILNLFRALWGVSAVIFLYEVLNLIISIQIGRYVRIDNSNLNEVIQNYISYAIFGYAMALLIIKTKEISRDESKNAIEKTKKTLSVFLIIFTLLFIAEGIILNDILASVIIIAIMSLVVLTLLFIVFLIDKKDVKAINKKLEEENKK